MNEQERKQAAQDFADYCQDKGYEKGESQKFWLSLLRDIYGVEHPERFINFEDQVHLDYTSFIDGMIPSTRVMIEQKGREKNLKAAIRQSDGSLLNPFQQAKRYITELPVSQHPKYVITCNFQEFLIYDMDNPQGEPQQLLLKDLPKEAYRLDFLVDEKKTVSPKELRVSIDAGKLVGRLYDALLQKYKDPTDPHSLRSLNVLCVRLVFCLYAEDAGIFGSHSQFYEYLAAYRSQNVREALIQLFRMLDTKPEDRDPYANENLLAFPYVNGSLFADEGIEIPRLDDAIVGLIMEECSLGFNWADISPTIFGAVFESTLNPETRRSGGMHYTSIENIHKVIDPLFLDDLKKELQDIEALTVENERKRKLLAYQDKLASLRFLDPACGSGNFLTETYLSLRKLENEAISDYTHGQMTLGDFYDPIKVSISQFYGIEINDFAVTVAKTALWIAESQMLQQTESIVHQTIDFLPLKTNANIVEGNALRMEWESVVPKDKLNYIMGNPPFVGARLQSEKQKLDLASICVGIDGTPIARSKFLDYVAGWYLKTAKYIQNTKVACAFVSTNSITQGEQVPILWKSLFGDYNIHINFAYRTFEWSSEANEKAHVNCVIIGFSLINEKNKYIWAGRGKKKANYINGFLLDAPDCFIKRLTNPLCDVPKMSNGNRAYDGNNLILSKEEKEELIYKEPLACKYIKTYFMGRDLLQNKPRYVLWLVQCAPSELKKMPNVLKRVAAVKEMRLNAKGASTKKAADYPTIFQTICQPSKKYLAFPRVSSQNRRYIPMTFLDENIICGDKLIIIPEASMYHFGILMSNVHNAWMRVVTGRLKSDYEYSTNIYNNFPWPTPTPDQKTKIEQTAQGILDARALYPDSSLADLYDQLTMPPELRKAHQENDRAVMQAYGFDWRKMTESDCVSALMQQYQKLTEGK